MGLTHPFQPDKKHLQVTQLSTNGGRDHCAAMLGSQCSNGSLPGGPAGRAASPPKSAALAVAMHPKIKARLPLLPSLKVLSPAPGAPVGQRCSEQSHRAPWIPEQGTAAALKGEYSSLYPACETQNSDCCLGWQKTQSLLPNWPTKPFCKGPGSFTLLMAPSIKELKALLFEPRRPEAYLKKMYI